MKSGLVYFVLLLESVQPYTEYLAREILTLDKWTRTFENGSTAEVTLPNFFLERERVSFSRALPALNSKALIKFTCSLRCTLSIDGSYVAENNSTQLPIFLDPILWKPFLVYSLGY